jgi:hypothetical protein
MYGHFLSGYNNSTTTPPVLPFTVGLIYADGIAYADNWPPTLFSQITYQCNSQTVELLQNPAITDTAQLYSTVDKTWLKSFGSSSCVGESFTTRLRNSSTQGDVRLVGGNPTAASGNWNQVTASWRPALSIFDCPHGVPPGQQHRFEFSWNPTGEQNMIESVAAATAGFTPANNVNGQGYEFVLDSFTFFCATITPDVSIEKPLRGLIELNPLTTTTYTVSGGSLLQAQVALAATTNRILVVIQDNNSSNALAAGQNGLKPLTSFTAAASLATADFSSYLQTFYLSLPELGYQWPNPTYNFQTTGAATTGMLAEWKRAYTDWINTVRGASGGYEGSVSFGSADAGIGVPLIGVNTTVASSVLNTGDPNNDQAYWAIGLSGTSPVVTTANQTARWGWLGRCPGPIFAIPVIRPPDKTVSYATLNMQFASQVTSVNVYVIQQYSMGMVFEADAFGKYAVEVLRGI